MRRAVAYLNELLKNRSGSMTVEFVAFAPLLLASLTLAFEFGRAFWAYDVVTRDVRAAVRYLTRNSVNPPPYTSTCPASAENVAQTGLPGDSADANKHFPWKGASATFQCVSVTFDALCPSLNDCGLNDDGSVVTMTATVQVTLPMIGVLNNLAEWVGSLAGQPANSSIGVTYPLKVSYQARYVGN